MVAGGGGGSIRIIDYVKVSGFWDEVVVGPVGTRNWVAPEVGPEKTFNPVAADLWSAGKFLANIQGIWMIDCGWRRTRQS